MAPIAGQETPAGTIQSLPPYPDRFYIAAQYAAVPDTVAIGKGAAHPLKPFSDLTSLLLYSLYQQACNGPCTTPKPWFLNVVESAKWASWKELGNMPPVEAMRLFVRTLEEEDPDWWTKAHAAPGGDAGTPAINGSILDFEDDGAEINSQLQFLPDNQWEIIPVRGRKPAARYQHAAVVVGLRMFVIGGNSNGRYLNDIQVLNLATLTWMKVDVPDGDPAASLPPCAGHSLVRKDNRTLLVIGGHGKDGSEKVVVRALDTHTGRWSLVKTYGTIPSARGSHSISRVGNVLWMFGGEDSKRTLLDDVHTLDLDTWMWDAVETSGNRPSPRSDHVATIHGGRFLTIFGGGSHSYCFNDLYVLDLETLIWSQPEAGGASPGGRAGHAGVVIGSSWYIIGGGDNKGGNPDTVVMDLDSFTWSVVATAPERTAIVSEGLSVVAVEGQGEEEEAQLLAFGGYNGRYSNEVFAFRPGSILDVKPSAPMPVAEAPSEPKADEEKAAEAPAPSPAQEAPPQPTAHENDLERQLEEAAEAAAKAEKAAMNVRAEAEYKAAKARADAWLAIGKAKQEEEGLREQLTAALKGKEDAEAAHQEAQAQLQEAREEASRLNQDLLEFRRLLAEAQLKAKTEEGVELARVQKDYMSVKAALAEQEQELHSVRGSLAGEQARCFRLEVEVAELRQRLHGMEVLERELDLLRRQKAASDEAAAEAAAQKSAPGVWSWLAGPPPSGTK